MQLKGELDDETIFLHNNACVRTMLLDDLSSEWTVAFT